MSKKPAIHTVPDGDGGWINRTEGADRGFAPAPTKREAEQAGRDSAERRGVEQISHRRDGHHRRAPFLRERPVPAEGVEARLGRQER